MSLRRIARLYNIRTKKHSNGTTYPLHGHPYAPVLKFQQCLFTKRRIQRQSHRGCVLCLFSHDQYIDNGAPYPIASIIELRGLFWSNCHLNSRPWNPDQGAWIKITPSQCLLRIQGTWDIQIQCLAFYGLLGWRGFSAAFDKTLELQLWLEPSSDFNDPIASPTPAKGLFSMPKNCDPVLFQIRLNWTGWQICKVWNRVSNRTHKKKGQKWTGRHF